MRLESYFCCAKKCFSLLFTQHIHFRIFLSYLIWNGTRIPHSRENLKRFYDKRKLDSYLSLSVPSTVDQYIDVCKTMHIAVSSYCNKSRFGGSQFGRKLKIATIVGQVGQSEVECAFEGIESSLLKSKKEIPLEGMTICWNDDERRRRHQDRKRTQVVFITPDSSPYST